ncbi:MAG: hypothetical protein KDK39_16375, partial [Leptospiraceae bacterium]|nr:hypothetical protein [Leptospiraceae bacterium]
QFHPAGPIGGPAAPQNAPIRPDSAVKESNPKRSNLRYSRSFLASYVLLWILNILDLKFYPTGNHHRSTTFKS